jgi:hypothetical protein
VATVTDLEQLAALLRRLEPLGSARRGTAIRADDWNLLVAAVVELARSTLAGPDSSVVVPHEHTDQVQLSWLDGRLRSLVQAGGLSDPTALARFGDLDRALGTHRDRLDELDTRVGGVRSRLTDLGTRDLVREADVTTVRRTVTALGDARQDVFALRESLDGIRGDLDRVIEIGRLLQIDGRTIDVRDLSRRVALLEELRQRLTGPDGTELDAAELERRLTELTTTLVTEDELDEALRTFRPELPDSAVDLVRERILSTVDGRVTVGLEGLRGELLAAMDSRLSDVDGRVSQSVDAALPGLREQVLAQAAQLVDGAVGRSAEQVLTTVRRLLADAAAVLSRDLGARIDDVAAGVADTARAEAERVLEQRLQPVSRAIAELESAVDELRRRLERAERTDATQAEAIAGLRAAVDTVDARIARSGEQNARAAGDAASAMVDRAATELRAELISVTGRLVDEQVGERVTRLRGEIREITRDELARAMPEIDRLVAGRLEEHVKGLPDTLVEVFRADIARKGPLLELLRGALR